MAIVVILAILASIADLISLAILVFLATIVPAASGEGGYSKSKQTKIHYG